MNTREFVFEKTILILISLLAAAAMFAYLTFEAKTVSVRRDVSRLFQSPEYQEVEVNRLESREEPLPIPGRVLLTVLTAIGYPVVASVVVAFCARLRRWAYRTSEDAWDDKARLEYGAIWPVTLVACLIVYVFLGIIHRVF